MKSCLIINLAAAQNSHGKENIGLLFDELRSVLGPCSIDQGKYFVTVICSGLFSIGTLKDLMNYCKIDRRSWGYLEAVN